MGVAVVFLLVALGVASEIREGRTVDDVCETRLTCDACAQGPGCEWCLDDEKVSDGVQCKSAILGPWCNETIVNADTKPKDMLTIDIDKPFTKITDHGKSLIQLKPQAITINARPGQTVPFELSYRPAKDYPLDVYYLIDYSSSMNAFIQQMEVQGLNIYNALRKLTNNVHMGVGSFIEKPALPYSSKYMGTYSFKNHLALQDVIANGVDFAKILSTTQTKANFDNPEAGLDALLQVMVCHKKLQWRKTTTRLILFITDDMYHSAGDGKMVGAYRRHDGKCYVGEDGMYDEAKSLELDYPSVPYLNYIAKREDFTIIFVVAKRVLPEYEALAGSFANAKAKILAPDGSDVIDLIKSVYLNMTSQLKLVMSGENKKLFDLSFDRDCRFENKKLCKVEHNSILKIKGELKVDACPTEGSSTQDIVIQPQGTSDKLKITLNIVCNCKAFNQTYPPDINSPKCKNNGTFHLGTCTCNTGRSGKHCECDNTERDSKEHEDKCRQHPYEDVCSERGVCECGQCVKCTPPYTGRYCECSEMAMECMPQEPDAPVCWGNGKCGCDRKCKCKENYDGALCHHYCDPSALKCQHVYSDQVCSGVGRCVCAKCDCPDDAAGHYCEQSADSAFLRDTCARLQPCVTCHRDGAGGGASDCSTACTITTALGANGTRTTHIKKVRFLETKDYESEQAGYTECRSLKTGASCHILFKFSDNDIVVQNALDCTAQEKILMTVIGVIIGVVVVGLVTLVAWKLLTELHDRREFARFQKEMQNSDWGDNCNPIYNAATTTVRNPAYKE